MTTTDWIIDIALVLMVVRQLREEKLTVRFLVLPIGIVAFVAHTWLHAIPTGGNDLALIGGCLALGTALGVLGGLITKVRAENGSAFVRAGWGAAVLWVASMGARLGFIIWITHSAGQSAIARFSIDHHLTGADVWQDALVLLALSEVVARIGLITVRGVVKAQRSSTTGTTPRQLANV